LGEEGHGSLKFSEEGLQVFVGGFAPEVAVFVAERFCFGYGSDLRQVLFEIQFDLAFPAGKIPDAELAAGANVVDGKASG